MATKQKRVRPVVDGIPWSSAVRVKNSTGSTINAETMVYFSGVTGKMPTIAVANASTSDEPERTLWVTRTAIPDGSTGHVVPWGVFAFSGGTAGAALYLKDDGTVTPNAGNPTKSGIVVGEVLDNTAILVAPALSRGALSGPRAEAVTTGGAGTVLSPTKTLVARDSGTTYFVTLGHDACFKLPSAAIGLEFEFIIQTTGTTHNFALITAVASSDFVGFTQSGTSSPATVAAQGSTIEMDASTATTTAGDYIRVKCDGTNWHVRAQTVAASIVFAAGHTMQS